MLFLLIKFHLEHRKLGVRLAGWASCSASSSWLGAWLNAQGKSTTVSRPAA